MQQHRIYFNSREESLFDQLHSYVSAKDRYFTYENQLQIYRQHKKSEDGYTSANFGGNGKVSLAEEYKRLKQQELGWRKESFKEEEESDEIGGSTSRNDLVEFLSESS